MSSSSDSQSTNPKRWYYHGKLPHFDHPDALQFITWHLADSLPRVLRDRLEQELASKPITETEKEVERRQKLEALLDRGYGNCWLRRKRAAQVISDTLLKDNQKRYHLHAYIIMPNHLHMLVQFLAGNPMGEMVAAWKSVSTPIINQAVGRSGELWNENYWDRYIRDAEHYDNTVRYIKLNPVKAGLISNWRKWPYTWIAFGKKFTAPKNRFDSELAG